MRRPLLSIAVCAAAVAFGAAPASAKNLFTLDPSAAANGGVVQDASGTAYVAWSHHQGGTLPDFAMFCKIPRGGTCTSPISLPLPPGDFQDVSDAFPVLGSGSTVYVVAPRYVMNNVVLYTSTNGGQSFGTGAVEGAGSYSNKTNPTNVILKGSTFLIGAHNPGLGFSAFTPGTPQGRIDFSNVGSGGVAGSSLGLDAAGNPVEAYWNLSSPVTALFYRYNGSGTLTDQANWSGPTQISLGDQPRLAGGAAGLLLETVDQAAPSDTAASVVNVRKYSGTGFGTPVTVAVDHGIPLFDGGDIAQSPSGGHVVVAWPSPRAGDNLFVMHTAASSDQGASFAPAADVAFIGSGFSGDEVKLSVADDGQGWVSWREGGALQMADLSAITPFTPAPPPPPAPPVTPPVFPGPNRTITTSIGGGVSITLKLPKTCLQARQAFKAYVGTKVKHKIAHTVHAAVKKVTFTLDGVKVRTVRHKPFKVLITTLTGTAKSVHLVKAKVTVRVRKGRHVKTVTKTVKGKITIC